jgi:hypothetical protein
MMCSTIASRHDRQPPHLHDRTIHRSQHDNGFVAAIDHLKGFRRPALHKYAVAGLDAWWEFDHGVVASHSHECETSDLSEVCRPLSLHTGIYFA